MSPASDLDAVTLSLIRGALVSGVREVGSLIVRSSKSPTINVMHDYLTGFADRMGTFIALVRNTSIAGGNLVRPLLNDYPLETMRPGDLYCYNDPYLARGAITHTPDVTFVAPAFWKTELLGFCASFGHCRDVGGMTPGSLSVNAREIFQEGILIPPVRLVREGKWNDEVLRMCVRNSRYPDTLDADIRALSAGTQLGADRLHDLAERFGAETLIRGMQLLFDQSRDGVSKQLRQLIPDGSVRFAQAIDSDGTNKTSIWVRFELTKQGDRIEVDATGTDSQSQGPLNYLMDESVPMLALAMALPPEDETLLFNGAVGTIVDKVTIPEGSIIRPTFPAPLGKRSFTMGAVRHSMQGIAARVSEGRTAAARAVHSGYLVRAFGESSKSEDRLWSEPVGVGLGARSGADGPDVIFGEAQRNVPCEYMEMTLPVRMERYSINRDSGGPGLYRGGCGVIREFTFLGNEGELSTNLGNAVHAAWGVSGGQCGRAGSVVINPGTKGERNVEPFSDNNPLKMGDVVRVATSGGGGWGHPFDRPANVVRADVLNGFVSYESALEDYGVVFEPESGEIDEDATAKRRKECRQPAKLFHQGEYLDEIW